MWTRLPFLTPVALALRNMRVRWIRTMLTCLGIVLGVAVILAISITNESTLQSIRAVFDEASGKASLLVLSSAAGGTGFDQEVLDRVSSAPGVLVAAPAVQATTLLAREAKDWQIAFGIGGQSAGNSLQVLGVAPEIDQEVRQYTLLQGRFLRDGAYEAVITEKYATAKGLRLGDELVLLVPDGQERLEIVGVIGQEGAGLLNDGSIAFVSLDVVQDLFLRGHNLDEIDVVTDEDTANDPRALEQLKTALEDRLGPDYTVSYPASRGQLVTQMLSTYQQGLSFFSVVALFVGAFLIYNAFSMTVLERTRELGLLRALGMTRGQVLGLVLTEAGVLGIVGSALGVAVGIGLAQGLIYMLGAVVATKINLLAIPVEGLAQSLLVGGLVTLGSAFLPARQASRVSPLEALRVHARPTGGLGRLAWLAGLELVAVAYAALYYIQWRPSVQFSVGSLAIFLMLLGAALMVPVVMVPLEQLVRPLTILIYRSEGLLGSSNLRRSPGRTSLTVASLMVGLSMVIGIGSLTASFENDILSWVETALGGDLYVRSPLTMREQFGRQLESVPGVGAVTPVRYFGVKVAPASVPPQVSGENLIIFAGLDPATYRQVGEFQFAANQGDPEALWERLSQNGALFISTVVADRYELEQGDTLRLITRRGEHDFYVAAVAVDFTGQGFIVSGTYDDVHRWFGQSGADRFTIQLAPGYSTPEVRGNIEERYRASRNISVETTEEFKRKILDLSEQSFRLFDVLGLIGIVVAALGVVNTLMMNVLERQREIGGLRSLGMTRGQVRRMVLAEASSLGAIGGLFGLGFGVAIAQIFVLAMNNLSGYDLGFLLAGQTLAIAALIALGVSQASALYPAWRAAEVNIAEAIKHE